MNKKHYLYFVFNNLPKCRPVLARPAQDRAQAAKRHEERTHFPRETLSGPAGTHPERIRALSHLLAAAQLLA